MDNTYFVLWELLKKCHYLSIFLRQLSYFSDSFFFLFLNFILFFNFTILYWFCHISTWIRPRYTHVLHPEPSSRLPPCTIPSNPPPYLPPHPLPPGCHRAPALSCLHHTLNSDRLSLLHMVIYMFQWYSLKSSHPLLLPLCSKEGILIPK